MTIKKIVKQFVPNFALDWYHLALAHLADFLYGSPSKKLIVIGVTGTNGKSTTVNLIAKILEEAGHKAALTSTVNFKIGNHDELNRLKMTMPGRFFLQKFLAHAVQEGCQFAIIESSSEGILQHRQIGIAYDCMVFTNLTPEHIEAHGNFENYKQAKLEYFKHLKNLKPKFINGKLIPKTIVTNLDDAYGAEFKNFQVDRSIGYGSGASADIRGEDLISTEEGINFKINTTVFNLKLKGLFDFYNALAAVAATTAFGADLETCKTALEKITGVPGRMELINEGQTFKVLIDYAPEPESVKQLYNTINCWPHGKIIHILGSTGGGRDRSRRQVLGQLAARFADIVIITNEDPYDDDPQKIIDDVAEGSMDNGKVLDYNLFKILDRRSALAKAFMIAVTGDLVIITGKGAEQKMAVKDGYIPWDDRTVAREELVKRLQLEKTT